MFRPFSFLIHGLAEAQLNSDTLGCFALLFEQRLR